MSVLRRIEPTAAERTLADQFKASPRSSGAKRAFQIFERKGAPGRRTESWHYTDLRTTFSAAAPLAPPPDAERIDVARTYLAALPAADGTRFVLLDGRFDEDLSDAAPSGVVLTPGAPHLLVDEDADPVLALAGALAQGGLTLDVASGVDFGRIEIVHISRPGFASAAHIRLRIAERARGLVVERTFGAEKGTQRHRLTTFDLASNAVVEHVVAIADPAELELESQRVTLAERAEFRSFALVSAGGLTRRQIFARLEGPRAKISLAGLSLLDGERKADTTLEVTHAAVQGESREFFRHIVADSAAGVFQGKVIVAPRAQKTDGGMKSQAILLSPTATMNNKPELEIFADDVVCGHGATVGALDPEQLFYLRARGLPKPEAEAMLLEAFGAEAIERISDAWTTETVQALASAWFRGRATR